MQGKKSVYLLYQPSNIFKRKSTPVNGVARMTVYTFSYSQKNNFGSKNQEKYADPESTLFCHFLIKIKTVLCTTIYTCVNSH